MYELLCSACEYINLSVLCSHQLNAMFISSPCVSRRELRQRDSTQLRCTNHVSQQLRNSRKTYMHMYIHMYTVCSHSHCINISMYIVVYECTSVYKIVTVWVSTTNKALQAIGRYMGHANRKGPRDSFSATCAVKLVKIIRCPKRLRVATRFQPSAPGFLELLRATRLIYQLFFVAFTAVRAGNVVVVCVVSICRHNDRFADNERHIPDSNNNNSWAGYSLYVPLPFLCTLSAVVQWKRWKFCVNFQYMRETFCDCRACWR